MGFVRCGDWITLRALGHQLVEWLRVCHVQTVPMESTGVYWIPLFHKLERASFEVVLVNARHLKKVPGRKTDILDCQWLQQMHSYGLLSGSFRPSDDICVLRIYLRHRSNLVAACGAQVQHMQRALDQMNIHLHHVVSDLLLLLLSATTLVRGQFSLNASVSGATYSVSDDGKRLSRTAITHKRICEAFGVSDEDYALVFERAASRFLTLRAKRASAVLPDIPVLEADADRRIHNTTYPAPTSKVMLEFPVTSPGASDPSLFHGMRGTALGKGEQTTENARATFRIIGSSGAYRASIRDDRAERARRARSRGAQRSEHHSPERGSESEARILRAQRA